MQKQGNTTEWVRLRQAIIVAFFFMMIGTVTELYLLDHYEGMLQLIPLLCIGTSLLVVAILFFKRTLFVRRIFQLLMILTALSGVYGALLHLRANYEFEQEMKPTLTGWELFTESLSGALPTLAPGSMIVLALIGYSCLLLLTQNR